MGDYKKTNYTQNQEDNSFATDVNSNFKSKVDLNNLIKRVKDEEKRSKRQNIAISAAALSAIAVFGIILTL